MTFEKCDFSLNILQTMRQSIQTCKQMLIGGERNGKTLKRRTYIVRNELDKRYRSGSNVFEFDGYIGGHSRHIGE